MPESTPPIHDTPSDAQPGAAPLLLPGQLVGNYRILGAIGRGGMGEVFAAMHRYLQRPAAVKVLHPELARNAALTARFLNEGRAVSLIHHPGIVEIFELGVRPDGTPFIAMELLEGMTLGHFAARAAPLPLPVVLGLAVQITSAVAAAHDKGVVHRDLKPSNVMVVPFPEHPGLVRTRLFDFGLAKLGGAAPRDLAHEQLRTRTGAALGTPEYMAPEQCLGVHDVDARADVYSLGVMLYELASGTRPFKGELSFDVMAQHVRAPAPPLPPREPPWPEGLAALIASMLAKAPHDRPGAGEVLGALRQLRGDGAADPGEVPALVPFDPPTFADPGVGGLPTLLQRISHGGAAAAPPPRPSRVLVVDDDPVYTDTMSGVLQDDGHECVALSDGEHLLETVRSFRPDLVLLDVELPGPSGYRLCWLLKTTPETQHTPVALVSAKSEDADHRLGVAVRADAYIDKPFEVADLLAMVRLLLAQARGASAEQAG